MVGASQRLAGRQESCRDSWVCALTSKWQVGVLLGEHRGWILRMTSLYKGQTVCRMQAIRHENLSGFLQNSDRKPSRLPFRLKELWTFACFPVSQHSGFYFPPSANKDRAVNIIEIKDFIILWTYSQWRQDLVVIPPFSPERETCCMNSFSATFGFLPLYKT